VRQESGEGVSQGGGVCEENTGGVRMRRKSVDQGKTVQMADMTIESNTHQLSIFGSECSVQRGRNIT
jgi:hypothetical protein